MDFNVLNEKLMLTRTGKLHEEKPAMKEAESQTCRDCGSDVGKDNICPECGLKAPASKK